LICELGRQVFERAARQQAQWAAAGRHLTVSVNVSARQLADPELLLDMRKALDATGADPARMQVEITESLLLGSDDVLLERLHAIRAMGLSIALDDFGTGYSNLVYLQRFPITTLKIDKTFIQAVETNGPLTELIVSMCRLMNLSIVAEGVETPDQLRWVTEHGIERFQGYLYSRPLSVAALEAFLAASAA